MGPLAPELIGNELNLVVAMLLGIAFGFILEQAGFSNSRRLAGLFYGYDFVVLRVFFTAAITAMIGLILLAHFGLINLNLIYINPTFLRSTLVGGVIMGAGFILGGFCPGTSVCAAAIGKIDAMLFIVGIFTGVYIFGEIYPMVESLYHADAFGDLMVYKVLGIEKSTFVFILIIVAVMMFRVVRLVERKINGQNPEPFFQVNRNTITWTIVVILGLSLSFLPDMQTRAKNYANSERWEEYTGEINQINIDELAFQVVDKNSRLKVIDVRNEDLFKKSHVPGSTNISLEKLGNPEWRDILSGGKSESIVFYGETLEQAEKAALMSQYLKDDHTALILNVGYDEFQQKYMNISPEDSLMAMDFGEEDFVHSAQKKLQILVKQESSKPAVVTKKRKVQGGC